jgi:hypothetical protein
MTNQRFAAKDQTMTDDIDDEVTMLRLELGLLSQACARLKTHPALSRFHDLSAVGTDHADLMLHYVDQLDHLFATVTGHATTLERLAADNADADEISHEVRRTITELDRTISPMIQAMRRHAQTLRDGVLQDADISQDSDKPADGHTTSETAKGRLH